MNPIGKIIIGIIVALVGLYYIIFPIKGLPKSISPAWPDVVHVLNGIIPVLVFLIGLFIIWMEYDEWKINKELEKEERKARRKRKKKKK